MFERFSDGARRVMALAQEEALLLQHNLIGTEHLLLGLIREHDGVAARALEAVGVQLDAVRTRTAESAGPAEGPAVAAQLFTPRGKKVLELSLREALQLGQNRIYTEHLLLGIIRESEGLGAQIILDLGIDLVAVRQTTITLLAEESPLNTIPEAERVYGSFPWTGPRCPSCKRELESHINYRILPVPPRPGASSVDPVDFLFVYCSRCGVMLHQVPATDVDEGEAGPEPGQAGDPPQGGA